MVVFASSLLPLLSFFLSLQTKKRKKKKMMMMMMMDLDIVMMMIVNYAIVVFPSLLFLYLIPLHNHHHLLLLLLLLLLNHPIHLYFHLQRQVFHYLLRYQDQYLGSHWPNNLHHCYLHHPLIALKLQDMM